MREEIMGRHHLFLVAARMGCVVWLRGSLVFQQVELMLLDIIRNMGGIARRRSEPPNPLDTLIELGATIG